MNEIMSLEQLEKLAKNPAYKLSEAQLALMEELRTEQFKKKHPYTVKKDTGTFKIHKPQIEEPDDGTSRD